MSLISGPSTSGRYGKLSWTECPLDENYVLDEHLKVSLEGKAQQKIIGDQVIRTGCTTTVTYPKNFWKRISVKSGRQEGAQKARNVAFDI